MRFLSNGSIRPNHRTFSQTGEYAGRAIYRPRRREDLKAGLHAAIGQVVDLQFVGVARNDEAYRGQNLYQEYRGTRLHSSWVPEEDLQFIDERA